MTKRSIEQDAAEAEVQHFREELGPFVVAAEETRMAMVFSDAKEPDNPIIFANDSFLKLTKYTRDEVLGQSFNFLIARGTDKAALTRIEAAFEGDDGDGSEIRYRRKDIPVYHIRKVIEFTVGFLVWVDRIHAGIGGTRGGATARQQRAHQ